MTTHTKLTTNMRSPVEVERQVVLTLYYLSDEGRLRKTANAFGLLRSTTVRRLACVITIQLAEMNVRGHRHKEDYVSIQMNLNEDIHKCPSLWQQVFMGVFDRHERKEATKFCWKQLWDVTPWVVYSSTCQLSIFSSVWWCTFYTFNDAARYLKHRTQTT